MCSIVRQHSAAFAGSELLVGIEAKDGQIAEAAGALVFELRADGLACILDHGQVVAAGDAQERVHLGRNAEGVNDKDGPRSWRNGPLDAGGVKIKSHRIDLRKDRRGADLENRIGNGDEREGRHNHLVAFTDAECEQSEMQSCCA